MISPLIRLSHVTFQASNAQKLIKNLVDKYRFHPFAVRSLQGGSPCQVALRNGGVVFMVNENNLKTYKNSVMLFDSPLPIPFPDTACNVSFEVDDVPGLCRRLVGEGCQLLVPPMQLHDDFGSVTYCIVKSIVGNVNHTLIDRSHYKANFLPGFDYFECENNLFSSNIKYIDHVTYACPRGETRYILEWYRRCFGFQHFPLSEGEDPGRGFEISGPGIGLRLTSMACTSLNEGCKIVVAESLPQEGPNQIDQFLKHHKKGGIQHIALSTPCILKTTRELSELGVCFAKQPSSYYSHPRKREEIYSVELKPELLSQFGILLDSAQRNASQDTYKKFLLQVFAEPLFYKDSVYLEFIERRMAEGFGEGNIRALWHSMQNIQEDLHLKEQEVGTPTVAQ
ncbi:hypothetical protein GDO86_007925 [Hymenochirus boettgeri]|uniref:4-hydroxyphenylpyruvate dioxygenase n=1 Tax=Hymenochirus boettgeri TaxID=247094 RepID=A0A8T2IZI3_9PIPI|nr:hypothetical protein GDO86_007925 [Hymenochirus boettgeri]